MLNSSLSPWLVNETVNGLAGRVRRAGSTPPGCSVTFAVGRARPGPVPCRPGPVGSSPLAAAVAARGELLAELGGDELRPTSSEISRMNCDGSIVWPPTSASLSAVLDERADARLVQHVGGVERAHLAGDRLDRRVGRLALVAERRADVLGDLASAPSRRSSSAISSDCCAAAMSSGDAEACGLLERLLGRVLEADDLLIEVLRRLRRRPAPSLRRTPSAGLARLGGDARRPGGCSPCSAFSWRRSLHASDDADTSRAGRHRADDHGDHAPDQHVLGVARPAAGGAAAARARARARAGARVVRRGSSSSSKKDKSWVSS